jgi:hypothetical protein
MKLSQIPLLFVVITSLFLLNGCPASSDKNDACDKTKWTEVREPVLYLYIKIPSEYVNVDEEDTSRLHETEQIICSGSITKIYCGGKVSGSFDFDNVIFSIFYSDHPTEWAYLTVKVGQAYQFKFENDNDYLLFTGRLKAYFPKDIIWESDEFSERIYFKDIKLNPNSLEQYYLFEPMTYRPWFRVTS